MTDPTLVERLVAHQTIGAAPRDQLEWLAARGTILRFEAGEQVASMDEPIHSLYIMLSGYFVIRVDRGSGLRRMVGWRGGDVGGLLPYSRLSKPPGNSHAVEPSEILAVSGEHFPEMIARCHELTAILVHVMVDRARRFTRGDLHDEKMVSLGRLAAGVAHELNNPASAVARSAREIAARLFELEAASLALGAAHLSPEQLAAIARVRTLCEEAGADTSLSPLERADREEAVADWLRGRVREETAEALADAPVTVECLEPLAAALDRDALEFALRSISASYRARQLAAEIETASERVHTLVAAIKGFTYMDQSNVPTRVSIGKGLADTMVVLGGKARQKSVNVSIQVDEDLPEIEGFGGELNQVWANLIDNAIDAVPESGRVDVRATEQNGSVVVCVANEGPEIPSELLERIFEPFFTTKPIGQGTGLGLDIVRRVVEQHSGKIEVESQSGRTEFRVILPRADAAS